MTVVIGLPFAREDDRQDEHEAHDTTNRPSLREAVVGEVGLKSDEGGERPSANVGEENEQPVLAGFIGTTLQGDRQETSEEDGRNNEEEDRKRSPTAHDVVVDFFVLLLRSLEARLLGFSQGSLFVKNLALSGGLSLRESLILRLLGDGLLFRMDGTLR